MVIVYCDRCGKQMERCGQKGIEVNWVEKLHGPGTKTTPVDLCKKCENAVYRFIFGEEEEDVENDG